ncbi:MAG: 3-hydroxyacyl-CoA dehydrogenase NAD-binding domain-containing protein [Burkholderiaceae bacterium]
MTAATDQGRQPFSTEEIRHVGVVAAGQMGLGIAQVLAISGLEVTLVDQNPGALERALTGIERSLAKMAEKGKLQGSPANIRARIQTASALAQIAASELVIEAVTENESLKTEIFRALDDLLPARAIIASNTSSLPITRLASATKRPGLVIGMHWMNPVPLMKLVEIIRGHATLEATYETTRRVAEACDKVAVDSQDYPGFIVNRVLMPMINEAFFALMEGVASAADIDCGMKLGTNQPMGPLALADFIGLDTCLSILRVMHEGLGDSKYRPCPLLRKYVEAGHLGKKTGQGVFTYHEG